MSGPVAGSHAVIDVSSRDRLAPSDQTVFSTRACFAPSSNARLATNTCQCPPAITGAGTSPDVPNRLRLMGLRF
jgi:hypothetical protein